MLSDEYKWLLSILNISLENMFCSESGIWFETPFVSTTINVTKP